MTCRELIAQLQTQLGDPHGDYHSQTGLLTQVNQALRDISSRSRSVDIKDFLYAVEGDNQYPLPAGFLTMHRVAFNSPNWYPLHPTNLPTIESIASWISTNTPWYYDIWGNAAIEKAVDTVATNSSNELRVATAYPAIKAGDRIINLTDELSESIINGVLVDRGENWTEISYNDLIGGTRAQFETDDAFRILSPESAQKTLMIAPAPSKTDEAGNESLWIYYSRLHRQFEQLDLDRENDELELDLELETALIHRCLHWARGGELGFSDNETQAQTVLYETAYHTAIPHVRRRIKQNIEMWQQSIRVPRSGSVDIAPEPIGHVFNRYNF